MNVKILIKPLSVLILIVLSIVFYKWALPLIIVLIVFWITWVLSIPIVERIRRLYWLKTKGYWAEPVYHRGVKYEEIINGVVDHLFISGDMGWDNPNTIEIPNDEQWQKTMPKWAKDRKVEIVERVKAYLGNMKTLYLHPNHQGKILSYWRQNPFSGNETCITKTPNKTRSWTCGRVRIFKHFLASSCFASALKQSPRPLSAWVNCWELRATSYPS
jgi:hypothetical protein